MNSPTQLQEIASLLCENNFKTIEKLYDNYSPTLYGIALNLSKNNEEAEEILKKTFIQIKKRRFDFTESGQNLLLWMIEILRKTAACQSASSENRFQSIYVDKGVHDPFHIENKSLLMSPTQKKVLDLLLFGGKKINEVASELNIDGQTVKKLLREAVNQYRKEPSHTKWT